MPGRAPHGAGWVGAGAGAILLAAPLVGFAIPGHASEEKVVGSFGEGESWAVSEDAAPEIEDSAELERVHSAASRAKVRTPVEVSTCVVGSQPASGDRAFTRKQALYYPLQEGTYTESSPFSWRVSPISGESLMHEGVDWAAPAGTPIYSVADGVVTEVAENSRSGAYVVVTHQRSDGNAYSTAYLHQYPQDIVVSQGQEVRAGDRLGAVGSAGWSTGPHLHFEVRDAADVPSDPVAWLSDAGAIFLGEDC